MSESLPPVKLRIVLDLEDAKKKIAQIQKDAASGKLSGIKPSGGGGFSSPLAPGRGADAVAGAPGASAGGGAAGGFASFLGGVNRALLNPVGTGASAIGGAVGTAAAGAAVVAGTALFLEQIVPMVLASLADSLPDMPFFKEWAREFDEVSDAITEVRARLEAIPAAMSQTSEIMGAALSNGGILSKKNTTELFENLRELNGQTIRYDMDVEKEIRKDMHKQLMRSLAEGMQ